MSKVNKMFLKKTSIFNILINNMLQNKYNLFFKQNKEKQKR